ncbi:MerR family DNA-binding transcriptional regulator [Saccharopolyspora pogona]|uniref:MerR family DNA-binding transcriptional regulator n=1 Tax=Saccharopolyspora pogona TaxID=333966 RepID=UPI001CC23B68|nr:MerR family transcriptional regulator [Saccharopolyspora pogona]
MLGIGDFAQLTGLSAKALRVCDKQGLLKPAAVDPWSNYRCYTASQLELAVRLKALRAAGIGLAEVERALLGRREAAAVLEESRARQDTAQHWVGVVLLPVVDDDDEGATEHANAVFAALWQALAAEDNAPIAPFCSSMRSGSTEDEAEVLCCWAVARAVSAGWAISGWTVARGQVRAGLELVVGRRHDEDVPVVDPVVHPAVIVLLAEAQRRGADLNLVPMRPDRAARRDRRCERHGGRYPAAAGRDVSTGRECSVAMATPNTHGPERCAGSAPKNARGRQVLVALRHRELRMRIRSFVFCT